MATLSRDSFSGAARRAANGRFTSVREQLRRTTLWGLSRSEQAPFAAAIVALFAILAVLTILATVGSILSGILPQLGGGIAIGVLLGYLAMGRKPSPRRSDSTSIVVRDERSDLTRR